MDVKLPNGVIMTNVPEGMKKHQIAMKAIQMGVATNKDFGYDEVTDEDMGGTFLEGMGAGMVNTGRQAVNLLLPDKLTPKWASDEAIRQQEETDKYLTWGHGGGGKLTGEMVASLPLTMGATGALAKGGHALSTAGRGGNVLKAATATMPRRAAVEGAMAGSLFAGPDNRGAGAALGGVAGGVLSKGASALGSALSKPMVKITQEAKQLMKLTGTFIPLSQSAEAGLMKQFYNAFLANYPGVGGKLRGQYKDALDDLRRFIGENAHPPQANVVIRETDDVVTMMRKLDEYWETAFDDIKSWPVTVFKDAAPPPLPNFLARALKNHIDDGLVKIPKTGDRMTAADIISLKNTIGELVGKMGHAARSRANAYQKHLDALLKRNFNPTGKSQSAGALAYNDFLEASKYYPVWQSLKRSASAIDDLMFKPSRVARGAPLSGEVPVAQGAARVSKEALEDFPSRQGLFQTFAAWGPVASAGGALGGMPGAAAASLAAWGIGRTMLSKNLQRFLSGQTRFQRLNRTRFNRYKKELMSRGMSSQAAEELLRMPGRAPRQAAAIGAAESGT